MATSLKLRVLNYTVVSAAFVLFILLDSGTRYEFCTLCGKCRCVRTVRFPSREIGTREREDDGYSAVIAPLVHDGGGPHKWHVYRRRSLLGQAWDAVRPRFWRPRREPLRWPDAQAIRTACCWDPELAVAIAQRMLGIWSGQDPNDPVENDWISAQLTFVFGAVPVSIEARYAWNDLRRKLGLPELNRDETEQMIANGRARLQIQEEDG